MTTISTSFSSFLGAKKRDLYSAGRRQQQLNGIHQQGGGRKTTQANPNLLLQWTVTASTPSSSELHVGSSAKQAAPAGHAQLAELRPKPQISEEERQQIYSYQIPEFTAWDTPEIYPHLATASENAYQWLLHRRVDSLFHPGGYEKFCSATIEELPAKIYFDAGPQGMDFAVKLFLWSFAMDDLIDDTVLGMSPEGQLPILLELHLVLMWSFPEDPVLHDKFMSFVDGLSSSKLKEATLEVIDTELSKAKRFPGTVYDGKLSPLGLCFRDIWTTAVETGSEMSNLRIAHSLQRYCLGCLEQSKNREGKTVPSVEDCILNRRGTGGVEVCVVITDVIYEVQLSDDLFHSPHMQQLIVAINDIVCWHNDLYSFKKEVSKGDKHNLVIVVSHERKCSYAEAALVVSDMIESRMADLRKAAAGLEAMVNLEPADQQIVSMYINVCDRWFSGTEAFHRRLATTRFESFVPDSISSIKNSTSRT